MVVLGRKYSSNPLWNFESNHKKCRFVGGSMDSCCGVITIGIQTLLPRFHKIKSQLENHRFLKWCYLPNTWHLKTEARTRGALGHQTPTRNFKVKFSIQYWNPAAKFDVELCLFWRPKDFMCTGWHLAHRMFLERLPLYALYEVGSVALPV